MNIAKFKFQLLNATEYAAIAAYEWIGKNNEKSADNAAVNAMRQKLNEINFHGTIKIGEGERDKAPMLAIGENVGYGEKDSVDIAVDPLEGTTICSRGASGSMSVIAISENNCMLNAPDVYMNKIVTGKEIDKNSINIDKKITQNIKIVAEQKAKKITELKVIILDRPRHNQIIQEIREIGAKIILINDGDIAASINVINQKADIYVGIGGAPEGVLTAAAIKSLGGNIQGKLILDNEESKERAKKMGIKNFDIIYNTENMISGNSIFIATAITDSISMNGIQKNKDQFIIESIIMSTEDKAITKIKNTYSI